MTKSEVLSRLGRLKQTAMELLRLQEEGVDHVLTKPGLARELKARTRAMLEESKACEEAIQEIGESFTLSEAKAIIVLFEGIRPITQQLIKSNVLTIAAMEEELDSLLKR